MSSFLDSPTTPPYGADSFNSSHRNAPMTHPSLPHPTAILFDWDNTLVDTWPIIHQALHETMTQWEITPWTLDEVKLRVGKSMRDAFPAMFGEDWEAAGDAYMAAYRRAHLDSLQALPDALFMLEAAHRAAAFIGIVSNKKGDNLRKEVTHMGWERLFHTIIGAGDAEQDKPNLAPALLALQSSKIIMTENVWFIGDTTTDLECAAAGGMTAILYGDVTPESPTHYRGFPYAAHVRDHKELEKLLRSAITS